MSTASLFYICPVCFQVCESRRECHRHLMVRCDAVEAGDERRKPLFDAHGRLVTRAPRWFLEAVGWIPVDHTPDRGSQKGQT